MVLGGTDGSNSAGVQARIHALLVDTSTFRSTLGTHHALGSAVRRLVYESRLAGAHGLVVHGAAVAVGSARRRIARVKYGSWRHRHRFAAEERISSVSWRAVTSGHMFLHRADGIFAADIVAGIHALETHAGLGRRALIVILALTSASALGIIRISFESIMAVAGSGSVSLTALGMRTARRRFARRGWRFSGHDGANQLTTEKRITLIAVGAGADSIVLHDLADGVTAARSWARIHTSLLLAGQMVLALVVVGALRSAVRWSSNIVGVAGAGRLVADLAANGIGSTRRRNARIVGTLFLLGG